MTFPGSRYVCLFHILLQKTEISDIVTMWQKSINTRRESATLRLICFRTYIIALLRSRDKQLIDSAPVLGMFCPCYRQAAEHGHAAAAQLPKTSTSADPESRARTPIAAANMLSKPMDDKKPRKDGETGSDEPNRSREGNNSSKTEFLRKPEQGRTLRDDHDGGQGNTVGDEMEQYLGGTGGGGRVASHPLSRPSTTSHSSEPPSRTH